MTTGISYLLLCAVWGDNILVKLSEENPAAYEILLIF